MSIMFIPAWVSLQISKPQFSWLTPCSQLMYSRIKSDCMLYIVLYHSIQYNKMSCMFSVLLLVFLNVIPGHLSLHWLIEKDQAKELK